jgi:hypothetical protein
MSRGFLVVIAFAAAIAAPAAATPLAYDPCEPQGDHTIELRGDRRAPPTHRFSFRDDERRPHRRHRDGGHDFSHGGGDWYGHDRPDCTAVPEPSALALLGAATALLVIRARC